MRAEDWFIYFSKECFVADHPLTEFEVRNCETTQVCHHIRNEAQWFFLYLLLGFRCSFCDKDFHDGLNRRQWLARRLKSLYKIVDGVVYQEQTALLIDVQRWLSRALLEKCPDIFHELIKVEVYANCSLQLVNLILLEQKVMVSSL